MKIINTWNDVKLYQYLELIQSYENDSTIEKYIQFLCILSNTDIEYWYEKDIDDIYKIVNSLSFLQSEPESLLFQEIDNYKLIDLNKIKLGEFIDIEYFITNNPIQNLHKIASILYRQTKLNEWNEIINETYEYDLNKRSEYFLQLPITKIIGLIKYINDFKNNFNQNYKQILQPNINEEELDPIEELTIEDKKEIEKEKLKLAWTWEFLLHELSNGDITKYNDILELPLVFVFNNLTFRKIFNIK